MKFFSNRWSRTPIGRHSPHSADYLPRSISSASSLVKMSRRLGEWRGGVSPPRSLRTGREPLGSSGSQYPAVGMEKRPVREELWTSLDNMGEPLARAFRLLLEPLVLAARPFSEMEVDAAQTVVQRRVVEVTVVVDPTPEVG